MKITNIFNLPQALVDAAIDNMVNPVPYEYSATTLLKSVREVILERRHWEEITRDVSDMVWLIFGTAVHSLAEQYDKTGNVETRFKYELTNGYKLTGKMDIFNPEDHEIEDYKTGSVWKYIYKDFEDWKKQGLIYALLLRAHGIIINKLRFHLLMKDWTQKDKRLAKFKGNDYPEHPMWTWEYNISELDIRDIKEFVSSKFTQLITSEQLPDHKLPLCTPEERWNTGNKYAVMKNNSIRAKKICDTLEEAIEYKDVYGGDYIQERPGEDRKCQDYCSACEFCDYYQNYVKGEN